MQSISLSAQRGANRTYGQVIVAGLSALILTVGIARFAYTPLLPIMHAQAGLSYLAGGWLASSNYAGYMLGVLLAASLTQLRQKYTLYKIALWLAVLSTFGMGMCTQMWLWAILRFISGLTSVAGMLVASGLVLNWLMREGRHPELGLHFAGLGLGIVVAGVAVALMSHGLSWRAQWWVLGALSLVFLLPAWVWMPEPASSQASAKAAGGVQGNRWLIILSFAYFCAGFAYAVGATFIIQILEAIPFLNHKGGWVWALVGLAAVPASFIWDRLARRWGGVSALMLTFMLQMLSLLLPVLTTSVMLNLLSAVLFGNSFVAIVCLTLSMIGRKYPHNPAKAMAKLTLSYGAAQIVAPALAGALAAWTGSYHVALLVTVLMLFVGLLSLLSIRR